jgi:hypothetical protein
VKSSREKDYSSVRISERQRRRAEECDETNSHAIGAFRDEVTRMWLRSLRRRSQRDRFSWARMRTLATRWLPRARILHPWPSQRFGVSTRGRSPVR